MSLSVSGIGLGLVVAVLAAAPARADETVGYTPPVGASETSYGDTAPATSTAPQGNTATSTQTATATGGAGGSATGGNAGPSQGTSQGGDAYANGGRAESHNSVGTEQSSSGSRPTGNGRFESDGRDTYVVESTKPRGSERAAARTKHARSRQVSESRTTGRGVGREPIGSRGHQTRKAPPPDDGVPGNGSRLPNQNPFLSLLSSSGGAGTGLLLLLLAVLGASIVLPNHRFNAFRVPKVPWRPSAYVSPIELPG